MPLRDLCAMFDLGEIGKAFLILFAVIDIVGGIPLILQVRQKAGKIYPTRAVLVSLGIMITFLYLGEGILNVLGIVVVQPFHRAAAKAWQAVARLPLPWQAAAVVA